MRRYVRGLVATLLEGDARTRGFSGVIRTARAASRGHDAMRQAAGRG